jgi:hypothetical protein
MAVFRGQGGSKKSKPRRTTTKKRDRPTVTKTKKEGAPDTSAPTAAELMSGGVDRGLAEGVVNKARKDAAVAADRATGKFSGMPASTTPSGFVDIGGGAGQIDRGLALAAGLVQGDPWVSTSGWTPDTGVAGTGITGIDTTVDGGKVDTTTDGDKTEKDKEEEKKFYIAKVGKVNKRLYDYYQGLLKRMDNEKAVERVKLKKMEDEWAEKNLQTLTERFSEKGPFGVPLGPLGILKGALQKQPYENEFLGSAGAANILNKMKNLDKQFSGEELEAEKRKLINNTIAANPEGFNDMFSDYTGVGGYEDLTPEDFERVLEENNQGNKNFDKNYYKTVGAYWDVNTPQTSGDQQSMANAFQQGNLKMTKANTLAIQRAVDAKSRMEDASNVGLDRIGGGQPATDPIDPDADPNKPYGNLTFDVYGRPITNYDYTGGPEQLYLGGGWKKDGIYAGYPWGPHTFKEGGIANFKPYGY